ncbi:MAG: PRC-barrel domain-containing protein, partial [Owenweeksia sp.]
FEIADKNPDVRGWEILGNDGVKFGKVKELIIDTKAMKVRYLDVDVKHKLIKDQKEDLHILIPVGVAILNKDDKNVIIPDINLESLQTYPLYRREPVYVMRDYERSVRDYFAGERHTDHTYDPSFYDDKYYNDNRLF